MIVLSLGHIWERFWILTVVCTVIMEIDRNESYTLIGLSSEFSDSGWPMYYVLRLRLLMYLSIGLTGSCLNRCSVWMMCLAPARCLDACAPFIFGYQLRKYDMSVGLRSIYQLLKIKSGELSLESHDCR